MMNTVCAVELGGLVHRIMVHGFSETDHLPPHLHVNEYTISLIDILTQKHLVLLEHLQDYGGFEAIKGELMSFLQSPCINPDAHTTDNLSEIIYLWNKETDSIATAKGKNLLGDYCRRRGIKVLHYYDKYVQDYYSIE